MAMTAPSTPSRAVATTTPVRVHSLHSRLSREVKPAVSEADAIVVTGAAGFIGHAVAERLLNRGARVIGVDDFNAYYDVGLKEARAARLASHAGFALVRLDIAEAEAFARLVHGSGA